VQASSCAVYGNTEQLPVSETHPPDPLSPYAATKLAAEQAGRLYSQLYGVATVALRFFNVYGPRQDPSSPYAAVVPRFIGALRDRQQPTIYGDGQQSRDFIFVGDIVRALWVAGTTPGIGGGVYNVGRGEACTILDLASMIGKQLGVGVRPHFAPTRDGEVRHSCADVTRFADQAGFRAETSLPEGLKATIGGI
jgi:nucleoside-diphosphate-sugar epimerase